MLAETDISAQEAGSLDLEQGVAPLWVRQEDGPAAVGDTDPAAVGGPLEPGADPSGHCLAGVAHLDYRFCDLIHAFRDAFAGILL
ncbi:MAG: hypothetical protein EON57_12035 [Alphaproteobacteria bacterium]|nr:MAG: hypothetical protein EON57_12035 [Alphaproteobacteria bacterium]